MKKILYLLFLTNLLFLNNSFSQELSKNAVVTLLTQDEGYELYAYFGHTALRIKDDSLGLDIVFNYGTFDFDTPDFYTQFAKGTLNYTLSYSSYESFIYYSKQTQRTIKEQVLNLNQQEKQKILDLLVAYYNSEARYYRYDFLYDNCATKIRDIIQEATNNRIDFSKSNYKGQTYRQLLIPFLKKNYWIDFGINFILGLETDKKVPAEQYMFLPVYIHDFCENSEYAENSKIILDASPKTKQGVDFGYVLPWIIVIAFASLISIPKTRGFFKYLLYSIFGLLGVFILSFGLYSEHIAVLYNLNTIWTIPAFLILIFSWTKKYLKYIKIGYLIILLLHLLHWFWLPQQMSTTFLPWMFLLIFTLIIDLNYMKYFKKK
ncbi:MAG: DUF4105 domain-containing protein [Bacteroidales bacterium]|nr:DUF4105 domain-containing protein [Bacteroidales bacterium]